MSQLNNTLKLLNLKDENIIFYNNYLKEGVIKGKRSLIFEGYLTYTPECCPCCGCVFDKNIVIDMYKPYIVLIKTMFPNANIITDKFHTVQLINRALNKTRISLMNKDKLNYNKLKRYWKLLLRDRNSLNHYKFKRYTCFNHLMTEVDIVDYLLNLDVTLKESYWFYQHVREAISAKNTQAFDSIIDTPYSNLSPYMITARNTLIEHRVYIHNSINCNLTNARIEGINNLIKVIKRISFGYRSFLHFKARILLISDLIKPTYNSI